MKRPSTSTETPARATAPPTWQCPACPTVHERNRDLLREHLENVHWLEGDQLERALNAADPGATLPT